MSTFAAGVDTTNITIFDLTSGLACLIDQLTNSLTHTAAKSLRAVLDESTRQSWGKIKTYPVHCIRSGLNRDIVP